MVGRANVAYRAKRPVGHGRTLLLHIAHGGKLQIRSSSERVEYGCLKDCQTVLVGVGKCIKDKRENMSEKMNRCGTCNGVSRSRSRVFGKQAMLGLGSLGSLGNRYADFQVPAGDISAIPL